MAAPIWPQLAMLLVIVVTGSSFSASLSLALPESKSSLPISTISASPAVLPGPPMASPPALSPDITPLFPSPGGAAPAPSQSSLPTIPSSPSPPNPDEMEAPGPSSEVSPSGALPVPLSEAPGLDGYSNSVAFLGLMALGLVQLSGL